MSAEAAAKECERLIYALERTGEDPTDVPPPITVFFGTKPDPRAVRAGMLGPIDPWRASWRGWAGNGATCEMALVELQRALTGRITEILADEECRLLEHGAHVRKMRELVTQSESTPEVPK